MGVEVAAHKPPFRRGPSFAPRRRRPDSSPGGASRLRDSAGFQPVFAALRRTRAPRPGERVVPPPPGSLQRARSASRPLRGSVTGRGKRREPEHPQYDNPTIGLEYMADWLAERFGIDQRELLERKMQARSHP